MRAELADAVQALGERPLTEALATEHLRSLFSRTLANPRIYLTNHALGRPLDAMVEDLAECAALWERELGASWGPWLSEEQAYRASIAALIGAPRLDCVIPKVSAGHALRTVLNLLPAGSLVLTTCGEFDSVTVVLAQYAALGRIRLASVKAHTTGRYTAEQLAAALTPDTRLLVVSQVFFETGQLLTHLDLLAERCHSLGAELLVDGYHSVGALPVNVVQLGCDYLIGGCYKYLRGGPGAAFLSIAPKVLGCGVRPLDTGWFAALPADAAARLAPPVLRAGGDAFLEATPPVLTYYQARSGLAFTHAVGVDRLRAYTLERLSLLQRLLAEQGIHAEGADSAHGAFLTVACENAPEAVARLQAEGIVIDSRAGRLRLAPDCLSTEEELIKTAYAAAATCIAVHRAPRKSESLSSHP